MRRVFFGASWVSGTQLCTRPPARVAVSDNSRTPGAATPRTRQRAGDRVRNRWYELCRCCCTQLYPIRCDRLHKATLFLQPKHAVFGPQSNRFCCVFPACLYYTLLKTARKVLLLFSIPRYEKLITTTKENEWPRGSVIDFAGDFFSCKPCLCFCMAAAAVRPAAADRTDIPRNCRIFRYNLHRWISSPRPWAARSLQTHCTNAPQ